MVRGKTKLTLIENSTSRQVTFAKRKNGLLKKARELSELCGTEVAVIVYSHRGKLHQYSSKRSMHETIQRYRSLKKGIGANNKPAKEDILQRLKEEAANLSQRIEILEEIKSKLSGENLDGYSNNQLHEIETQMEEGLRSIRLTKSQLKEDEIEKLQKKNNTTNESGELHEKLLPLNKDTEGLNLEENCVNVAPSRCFELQGLDVPFRFRTCDLPHKEHYFLPLNQKLILPTPNRLIDNNIDANQAHSGLDDNIKAIVSQKFIVAEAYQLQLRESGSGFQNNSIIQEQHCILPLNQRAILSTPAPNILINNNIDGSTPAPSRLDDNINADPTPDRVHVVPDLNLGLPGQG